jgi:AraC-like DNA-binding protein
MHHAQTAPPTVSLRGYGIAEDSDVHDFHQIVFGLDGQMAMSVAGRESLLDAGWGMLVPAGARHDYRGTVAQNRQLVLDLPLTSLAVPQRLFERASTVALDPALQRVIAALAADPRRDDARFAWLAAARLCGALMTQRGDDRRGAHDAARLDYARIDAWLRAHLAEPLRVGDLAVHCGYGTRRFHQLFSDAFGETPHRYLHRLRLDTALALLNDASRSLTDIALTVGFADQSAFTHAFTARFGIAPGRWRRA